MIYDISSGQFTNYDFVVDHYITKIVYDSSSQRLVAAGYLNDSSFLHKFYYSYITYHPYVTESSFALGSIVNEYSFESVSYTLDPYEDIVLSQSTITEESSVLTSDSSVSYYSDVIYLLDLYTEEIPENTNLTIDLPLMYSQSGNTTISYSLSMNDSTSVPSWVTNFNTANKSLFVNAPVVASDTNFTFKVTSLILNNSKTFEKIVQVVVKDCLVDNCYQCTQASASQCSV